MNSTKIKLIVVAAILVLSTIWIIYAATGLLSSGYGAPRPLDTPGWRSASELEKAIREETGFLDVGLAVVSENPLKVRVVGAVHSQKDVAKILEVLKAKNPDVDIDSSELNIVPR